MRVLAIETSCDETAIAILDCEGDSTKAWFKVLGNALLSQVAVHQQYGGVYPNLAKREHAKNLVPILEAALGEAGLLHGVTRAVSVETCDEVTKLLERETGLGAALLAFAGKTEPPAIDAIAVTAGPGLEPALWVGINFAKALALLWSAGRRKVPLVAVNHMEGHILAALAQQPEEPNTKLQITNVELPVLALLISGGHTELVLMREWLQYELIGQTRDDAVGEAFDKVARLLGLPYPGGPEISKLAEQSRMSDVVRPTSDVGRTTSYTLPRPMLHDDTCDFSFSGLKTAVRYLLEPSGNKNMRPSEVVATPAMQQAVAREFEDAVTEVLWKKTVQALEATGAKTLVIGGGVSANVHIRRVFTENVAHECPNVILHIPAAALTTDNAIMIALAGYYRARARPPAGGFADPDALKANGNLHLA